MIFPKSKKSRNSGQSLVEMLVAISVIVIALLGILVLVNRSLGINRVASEHYTATYLAAEGIELVKNLIDQKFKASEAGKRDFYGWTAGTFSTGCIIPNCRLSKIDYGVYEMDYRGQILTPVDNCTLSGGAVSEASVRNLFSCPALSSLKFDFNPSNNDFSFQYQNGSASKFKRAIIIELPQEIRSFSPQYLDYRVTSAVGWKSRGGDFVVQLEDHFLPWRIP